VTYTNGVYTDKLNHTVDNGKQLVDFMIWKYCANKQMPLESWAKVIVAFAESKEVFPLPIEYCYANNLHWSEKKR